ncbi:hypothetical protein F4821DRAFT_157916 [Hypoxylon rubiginosum]|uniref:Uncharacterized protein n=1 Tax=Hypoxylon rubiginosum TaxID=110542 RepID=A0ACC0DHW9_9PEZI|nr:hypothetical protein F4821DRAFT_157916 [Hypoxylon rubiginosum]
MERGDAGDRGGNAGNNAGGSHPCVALPQPPPSAKQDPRKLTKPDAHAGRASELPPLLSAMNAEPSPHYLTQEQEQAQTRVNNVAERELIKQLVRMDNNTGYRGQEPMAMPPSGDGSSVEMRDYIRWRTEASGSVDSSYLSPVPPRLYDGLGNDEDDRKRKRKVLRRHLIDHRKVKIRGGARGTCWREPCGCFCYWFKQICSC